MDEIRLQVVIMTGEQNELLAARSAAFYEQIPLTALRGLGINLAAIVVLVLFYNDPPRFPRCACRPSMRCSRPTTSWNRWWRPAPSSCPCCRAT